MRTGHAVLFETVPNELNANAGDSRAAEILSMLAPRSYVVVPMIARMQVLGTMLLAYAESGRQYEEKDLALLEDMARRAVLAVDNARLYQEAQTGLAARDQFLSIASHEVRTPLSVIQGYAQLLKGQVGRTQAAEDGSITLDRGRLARAVSNIDHASARLVALVSDLLDVSRISEHRFSVSPEPLDLKEMLAQVIENVRGLKEYRQSKQDLEFEVVLPDAPVWGIWDRVRIEQVLANLVDNALKYSPKRGTVRVQLRVESTDGLESPHTWAHLTVSDQGIGVPADEKDRIFEPFTRASNASEQHYPGLGLGLAVTKEIVLLHKGCIWVESPGPGQGSTFHVALPMPTEAQSDAASGN